MNILFYKAQAEDYPTFREMAKRYERKLIKNNSVKYRKGDVAISEEEYKTWLAEARNEIQLVFCDDKPIGYVRFISVATIVALREFYVIPEYFKTYAAKVYHIFEEKMKAKGMDNIRVYVDFGCNRERRFFAKQGYRIKTICIQDEAEYLIKPLNKEA